MCGVWQTPCDEILMKDDCHGRSPKPPWREWGWCFWNITSNSFGLLLTCPEVSPTRPPPPPSPLPVLPCPLSAWGCFTLYWFRAPEQWALVRRTGQLSAKKLIWNQRRLMSVRSWDKPSLNHLHAIGSWQTHSNSHIYIHKYISVLLDTDQTHILFSLSFCKPLPLSSHWQRHRNYTNTHANKPFYRPIRCYSERRLQVPHWPPTSDVSNTLKCMFIMRNELCFKYTGTISSHPPV